MKKNTLADALNIRLVVISSLCIITILLISWIIYSINYRDHQSVVSRTIEINDLISQIRINLLKSSEVEKAAVMADTDELSRQLAANAIAINKDIDIKRQELMHLVHENVSASELKLMNEFNVCWNQFRKIDDVLLNFAIENTNIKALSLSTTKGYSLFTIFEKNLINIINTSIDAKNNNEIIRLASDALEAALKIQYLHGPHISAANDSNMDTIETNIKELDATVRSALNKLSELVMDDAQASVRDAISAYDHFMVVTAEVLRLSRQNTNVRSFELSLGRKRKVTAECDEILSSLQELVRSKPLEATR